MRKLKPYDLVMVQVTDDWVEGGLRAYVGEIMGYPLPDRTIMLRRVPGCPCTLEQRCIDQMVLARRSYVHYGAVVMEEDTCFPTDMLRYDYCAPVNFTLIDAEYGPKAVIDPEWIMPRPLVARCSNNSMYDWTQSRWRTFGASVEHIKTERIADLRPL